MIVYQCGPNTLNLVGANRRSHAATADRHSPLHISSRHCARKRDDVVGIVIVGIQFMGAEIDDFMGGCTELGDKLCFQRKPTVIGSDSYEHLLLPLVAGSRLGTCHCSTSSRESVSGCCHRDSALVVIRTRLPCRGIVSQDHSLLLANPAGRNRHISIAKSRKHSSLFSTRDEPEDAP